MIRVPFSSKCVSNLQTEALAEKIAGDNYKSAILESWLSGKPNGHRYNIEALMEAFGSDDFKAITTDQVHTSLLKGFNQVEPMWRKLCSVNFTDDLVRPQVRIDVGAGSLLDKVAPGEQGSAVKFGDKKLSYTVSMFEKTLPLLFEFYNSANFAGFLNVATRFGVMARETIEDLIINKVLLGKDAAGVFNNATFSFNDASAAAKLYTSANTLGASKALTGDNLNSALQLLAEAAEMDGLRTMRRPRYLVCGYANRKAALEILNSEAAPGANQGHTLNVFSGALEPIITTMITDSKWFVVADPQINDVIEVTFFEGYDEPVVTPEPTTSTRELKWSVRLAMGAAPLDPKNFVGANFAV